MTDTARRAERRRLNRGTGLKTLVDLAANTLLVPGMIAAFALLFGVGFLYGVSVLLGASLQWLLFRCIAEDLRLQQRIAGAEISGLHYGPNRRNRLLPAVKAARLCTPVPAVIRMGPK